MQKTQLKFANQEEPDLLVWRVPFEFTVPDASVQVFAIPMMLLLAVPSGVFTEDILLDSAIEEEGLLGPSRDFEANLLEEDDDANPIDTGVRCTFLVIDCSDAVCGDLRKYDPVTDSTENIRPYSLDRPFAFPATGEIITGVHEWIDSVASNRTAFYSAREEQEVAPKPKGQPAKKAATAKRVSNSALADQVAALTENMKLLATQQEEIIKSHQSFLVKGSTTVEAAAAPSVGGFVKRPGMPSLSAALPVPKTGQLAQTAKMVGPPPKVRQSPGSWRWKSLGLCKGTDTAECGDHGVGGSSHNRRCYGRPQCLLFRRAELEYKRRCQKRKDAGRSCGSEQYLLPPGAATALQEDEPDKTGTHIGGRSCFQRCIYDKLPRKVWRLQREQGSRAFSMDCSSRDGCDGGPRLPRGEGVHGSFDSSLGTICLGWRLATCLSPMSSGRSTEQPVRRSDGTHHEREAILSTGSPVMVGCGSQLPERGRFVGIQKTRSKESKGGCSHQSSFHNGSSGSKAVSSHSLSQEGEGSRCSLNLASDGTEGRCTLRGGSSPCAFVDNCLHDGGATIQPPLIEKTKNHKNSRAVLGSKKYKCSEKVGNVLHSPKPESNGHNPEFIHRQMMSYPKWCASLFHLVLRSRTPFAAFVSMTVQLSRRMTGRGPSTPALFPIPLPAADFGRMPASSSSARRRRVNLARTVHLVCMALNFWHAGGVFADELSLQRSPNKQHFSLYERIKALIRSDGTSESFQVSQTGRKFPNLLARLSELSAWLTVHGTSTDPYSKSFPGYEVAPDNTASPELQPYADLDPSRLVLHGKAQWDVSNLLPDDMLMAFLEPRSILIPETSVDRPLIRDDAATISALAKKWDDNRLLVLHDRPVDPKSFVRIFNARKDEHQDRQIGDRRGANGQEAKIRGPSASLPAGSDLCEIYCNPVFEKLQISITDRKDFYHQVMISKEKAWRNTLAPAVSVSEVSSTFAYAQYLASKNKRYDRINQGDRLGDSIDNGVGPGHNSLWVSFGSVLQGDHLGVEVATAAHTALLQSYGLLHDSVALKADRCLRNERQCQGLVTDDFFCVSVEPQEKPSQDSTASSVYRTAQRAYGDKGLLGSPQKDLDAVSLGKAIGATLNSSPEALSRKLVTLGAPPPKRISLSVITLQVSQLSHTTDALHLCILGAWVSVLGYRRPMLSLLSKSFHLVDQMRFDQNHPKLIKLPRSVACELCLVATLMPLAITDLSAAYHSEIFCSDASDKKGAFCKAVIPDEHIRALWKSERCKGAYSRLLSPSEVILKRMGELDFVSPEDIQTPQRPIAFHFDFLEIFAGASLITKYLSEMGFVCGAPVELSSLDQFNMKWPHVVAWITFLVAEKRLCAFFLCPPCTTFSIMRRPALRDAEAPYGFDTQDPQTKDGNILANRACQIMMVGAQNSAVGLLETPFTSKMKHMPAWKVIESLALSDVVRADSCRFGSIHQKGFKFMGLNINLGRIAKRCICKGKHVQVQGSYTKGSAIYTPKLAAAIADCFAEAILLQKKLVEEDNGLQVKGLESQLGNDIALSAPWEVCSSWTFRKDSHINILELASMLRLASKMAAKCKPLRIVNLVDSYVCRCAASKGRSSSRALSTVLRRFNAITTSAGLYWTLPYVPTRWNLSDDPTRDTELRSPVLGLPLAEWTSNQVYSLASLPKTKRWASHWFRLVVRLLGPAVLELSDRAIFRRTWKTHGLFPPAHQLKVGVEFDATLGYPGEGPSSRFWTSAVGAFLWLFVCSVGVPCCWLAVPLLLGMRGWCLGFFLCFPMTEMAMAMPVFPKNPGEIARAATRATRPELPTGRPVLPATNTLRKKYLDEFFLWTAEEGVDLSWMLTNHVTCIDEINFLAVKYGRLLYANGKTYNQFAETLNGLTTMCPAIRRLMQGAWDLGYAWVRSEPSAHHVAVPAQILMAMVGTSLMWGWCAGCLALGFGGLLRPGEFIGGLRSDLTLPDDCDNLVDFALYSIRDPKTRFSQARHQSSKIDCPDLLRVIRLCFGKLKPYQRLWPMSGQTFRVRFRQVLQSLRLPTEVRGGLKPLDPGSLRAGGASFLLLSTEDSELVRRRGRWSNFKMMEIYVQEVTAVTYTKKLNEDTIRTITLTARSFPAVLDKAENLVAANIPQKAWYVIFSM